MFNTKTERAAPAYDVRMPLVEDIWPHGPALSRARKIAGLSQEAAANRIGRTRVTWTKWESGRQRPDDESLKAIIETFGVPPEAVGYEAPEGFELVPSEWVRQQFELTATALRSISVKIDNLRTIIDQESS